MKTNRNVFMNILKANTKLFQFLVGLSMVIACTTAYSAPFTNVDDAWRWVRSSSHSWESRQPEFRKRFNNDYDTFYETLIKYAEGNIDDDPTKLTSTEQKAIKQRCTEHCGVESCGYNASFSLHKEIKGETVCLDQPKATVISDSSESRTTNEKSEIKTEIKESKVEQKPKPNNNNTQTANANEYSIEQQLEDYKSLYLGNISSDIKSQPCDLNSVKYHGKAYLDGVKSLLTNTDVSKTMRDLYLEKAEWTIKEKNEECESINQKNDTNTNNKQRDNELEKLKKDYLNETEELIKTNKCETLSATSTTYKNKVHNLLTTTYAKYTDKFQLEDFELDVSNTINTQKRKCNSTDEKKKCEDAGNLWKDNSCKKEGDSCTEEPGNGVGKYEKTAKGWKCKLTECKADGFAPDKTKDEYSCTNSKSKKQKTEDEKKADEYKAKMQELKNNYLNGLKDVVKSPSCNMKTVESRNKTYTDGHKRFSDLYGKYVSTEEQTKIKDDMDKTISDKTLECNTINCKKDGGTWKDNKCKLPGDDYDEDIKKVYEAKIEGLLNKNCDVTKVNSTFDEYKKATNDFQTKYPKKTDTKKQTARLKAIETLQKEKVDACNKIGKFKEAVQQVSNSYVQNLGRLKQQYDEEEKKIIAAREAAKQKEQQSEVKTEEEKVVKKTKKNKNKNNNT